MTTETIAGAVEKRQPDNTPGALVRAYSNDFAAVLPTHIKSATWVRLAQGALKKGKKVQHPKTGQPCTELELAASNNPSVFLASLLDAARLGLEPGTEQYYLTPRKVGGRLEILGIVGYQGYIELMYRAGAISSVVAEVVYSGDKFSYKPGVDERPNHEIDWDAEDRGSLRLVYAYAVMKDGATSRVVVMNKAAIDKVKKSSQGSGSEYSPWVQHEAAMWLKSSVRQLAKWVPTSAEYIREQIRAARDIAAEGRPASAPLSIPDEVVDAEVIEDSPEYQAHVSEHAGPTAGCEWCDADLLAAEAGA